MRVRPLPILLIPLAALVVIHPLIVHGVSCGQDMAFHLQSWLDAGQQLRHGHYPQWAFSPAWNAGEPRFVFYPPLSWLLGAALTWFLPIAATPVAFIFIALVASAFSMHHLAWQYVSPGAALLAAVFYLANPYMLFCAFERTAFAELMAAAWMPLLLLAVLKTRPTVRGIAMPMALLWLTNAPAAVMGCYTFALLALFRVLRARLHPYSTPADAPLSLAATYVKATLLGLSLPAFYLVPAAYERRFVQVAMAIIPNMRYQDNFLFTNTADAGHNIVNHTASALAAVLLALTALALVTLFQARYGAASGRSGDGTLPVKPITLPLVLTAVVIAFLLTPLSAPIWSHLPNLAYLQFPWRLLSVLATILSLALALSLDRVSADAFLDGRLCTLSTLLLALVLGIVGYRLYRQQCDAPSQPASIAGLFRSGHGAPPTDEYTPVTADNDVLRTDNPGYWLAGDLNDAAPGTLPTPSQVNPNIDTDDIPVPDAETLSTPAPHHFTVFVSAPSFLVLNLRDYPNWRIQVSGSTTHGNTPNHEERPVRDDGLLAIKMFQGKYDIDLSWHRSLDQDWGLILSLCAVLYALLPVLSPLLHRRSRRMKAQS